MDLSSLAQAGQAGWIRASNATTQKMRRIIFNIFICWSGFSHLWSAIATITACYAGLPSPYEEWTYNPARIDVAPVIWLLDLGLPACC
jgi:hypothetical protein